MKPELANLFTINSTGQQSDFVISFFYEWHNTIDGQNTEISKEKVASVVLSISDFIQLADTLGNIKIQVEEIKSQVENGEI